jgi:hypothetical protein
MGTRSLTHVISSHNDEKTGKRKKVTLLTMYRQFDGYPSGMGADLVEFLDGSKVVNGLGMDDLNSKRVFNGVGCLAAQLVAHFKTGAGGFYIEVPNAKGCWEEYTYEVDVDSESKEVTLRCYSVGNKKRLLFEGCPSDFSKYIEEKEEA